MVNMVGSFATAVFFNYFRIRVVFSSPDFRLCAKFLPLERLSAVSCAYHHLAPLGR